VEGKKRTSNGIIECLLGEVACLVGGIEDLIVEDGEVKSQTEANGVCGSKIGVCDLCSGLVSLERLVGRSLALVACSEFCEVSVVIALPGGLLAHDANATPASNEKHEHLVIEDLGLATLSRGNQMLVKHFQDIFADGCKLCFNLLAVRLDQSDLAIIALGLLLLLNRADDTPRRTTGADDVLVGDR
jgi:hypothetical protein